MFRIKKIVLEIDKIIEQNQDNKPIYHFEFHNTLFPKPDECIYKSEQNGTHLIKIKNGIVSIPPELSTINFSISYIAGH